MDAQAPDPRLDRTLANAAAGDEEAWRTLVEVYSPRVYGLLLRQCRDRELSEEITQATFVKVVTHLGRYQEKGRFEPWLFRIAMNRLRDEMRRRTRQARPIDMSPGGAPGSTAARSSAGSAGGGARPGNNGQWSSIHDRIVDEALTDSDTPLEQVSRAEQIEMLQKLIATMNQADQKILHLRHTAGLTFTQIAEALDQPLGTVLARGHRALAKLRKLLEEGPGEPEQTKPRQAPKRI